MKKWLKEEYRFRIIVVSGKIGRNGGLDCRNGHEIGDEYNCEYGCPDGFCSKSMAKLFPLMEAVRSGGDLRNLGGSDKNAMEFCCPDGVIQFRLEAQENE
jgi:uncharacterized repeat protein (TIGR04076 family)